MGGTTFMREMQKVRISTIDYYNYDKQSKQIEKYINIKTQTYNWQLDCRCKRCTQYENRHK